jgi:hypothetical protein
MPILNYTTTVPAARTAAQVQALLVKAGARGVSFEYDDQAVLIGMRFVVATTFGPRPFLLPVNPRKVQTVLSRQKVSRPQQTLEHAERVAWRIVKDWIEAQLALIATEMVSLDQVMLPYMEDPIGVTLYEAYVNAQQAIEEGRTG